MRTTGCKAFLLFLLLQGFEAQISYVAVHSGKCADRGFLTIKSKGKCEFARSTIRSWAYVSGDTVALTAQTYYESGYAYGCLLHYNNLIFQAWSSSIGCGEYFVGPNWYDTGVMVVRFYYLFLTVFRFVESFKYTSSRDLFLLIFLQELFSMHRVCTVSAKPAQLAHLQTQLRPT